MTNYKDNIRDIDRDYTSLYFAMFMHDEYGVDVGYTPVPYLVVNMQKELADWQTADDCCTLCNSSVQPIPGVITEYCSLPQTPNPCSPFQPLFANGYYKPCTV